MADKAFNVAVTREDGYWVGVVEGLRGGATESRRVDRLEPEVSDLVSGLLDVDEDALEFTWDYSRAFSDGTFKRLIGYHDAHLALENARREYENAQLEAVHQLREDEVSLRDSAALLGISFQRVQQLLNPTPRAAKA